MINYKGAIIENQIFIIPTFGIINESKYYGYKVIAIAFAWLHLRCKFEIGVKKYKGGD